MSQKKECVDSVLFNGQEYVTRLVKVPGYGWRTIAPQSLEDALIGDKGYVSDEARLIDEEIFFFLDDGLFNGCTAEELADIVARDVS